MPMLLADLNPIAVLLAALASMALGALWYSPLLFAAGWMAEMGITAEQIGDRQEQARRGYMVSTAGSVVAALVLAVLASLAGVTTAGGGALLGLVAGLGFVATSQATNYAFESRSIRLYLINTGYPVAAFAVMGAIVAGM